MKKIIIISVIMMFLSGCASSRFDQQKSASGIDVKTKRCTICGGRGKRKCSMCMGKTTSACPVCWGSNYMECNKCNGTGYIAIKK